MSRRERVVTVEKKRVTDRLPDQFTQPALLLQYLEATGKLDQIGKRLQVQRQGGYHGVDVLIFLLVFFASELEGGIKEFGHRTRKHRQQLAAVGGRRTLPAPASVSRLLSAVDEGDGDEFVPWLLLEGCDAKDVLSHPAVLSHDALGDPWHVFDFDPTTTVLRHRALPQGDHLPAGRRRSHEYSSGYGGRKRGDVQLSRATLQHAGSGLWTGIWTGPGNGRWRQHSQQAIDAVVRTCGVLGHDLARALIRVDGAGGNTPFIAACQKAGLPYLTRIAHYSLLDETEIRQHLNQAIWYEVQDSGSGPKRQATELGCVSLPCDPRSQPTLVTDASVSRCSSPSTSRRMARASICGADAASNRPRSCRT